MNKDKKILYVVVISSECLSHQAMLLMGLTHLIIYHDGIFVT